MDKPKETVMRDQLFPNADILKMIEDAVPELEQIGAPTDYFIVFLEEIPDTTKAVIMHMIAVGDIPEESDMSGYYEELVVDKDFGMGEKALELVYLVYKRNGCLV